MKIIHKALFVSNFETRATGIPRDGAFELIFRCLFKHVIEFEWEGHIARIHHAGCQIFCGLPKRL
jgi:hypothetical protein